MGAGKRCVYCRITILDPTQAVADREGFLLRSDVDFCLTTERGRSDDEGRNSRFQPSVGIGKTFRQFVASQKISNDTSFPFFF